MIQIDRIKEKFNLLKERDAALSIFGASKHRYLLNPPLSFKKLNQFEADNMITLPAE